MKKIISRTIYFLEVKMEDDKFASNAMEASRAIFIILVLLFLLKT